MLTILIIEDQAPDLYADLLELQNGHKIIKLKNGLKALPAFVKHQPDVVLTDIRLPGLSGVEVIRQIREFDQHVPIVAMSAFSDKRTKDAALEAGASKFLRKPLKFDRLHNELVIRGMRYQRHKAADRARIEAQPELREKHRRLLKLKEQRARQGENTPPEILTEIEDLEADLGGHDG